MFVCNPESWRARFVGWQKNKKCKKWRPCLDHNVTADLDWWVLFTLPGLREGCKCTPSTGILIWMKLRLSQIPTFHLNKKWSWFAININLFSGALGWACCWIRSVVHGITGLCWNTSWGIGRWAHRYTWYTPNWEWSGILLPFPDL